MSFFCSINVFLVHVLSGNVTINFSNRFFMLKIKFTYNERPSINRPRTFVLKHNNNKTMKTKLTVLALVMAFASVAAVAADPVTPKMVVVDQKESGLFKVIFEGTQSGRVTLKIYNDKGEVVFSETTHRINGFIRPVNFTGMTAGEYTVEVTDASGTYTEKVNYTGRVKGAKVAGVSDEAFIHIAKVGNEGKYLVAVPAGTSEEITVKIFDGSRMVHNQKIAITSTSNFGTIYTLKDVASPMFEVTDNSGKTKVVRY